MSLTPDIAVNHKYIMIAYAFLGNFLELGSASAVWQRKIWR